MEGCSPSSAVLPHVDMKGTPVATGGRCFSFVFSDKGKRGREDMFYFIFMTLWVKWFVRYHKTYCVSSYTTYHTITDCTSRLQANEGIHTMWKSLGKWQVHQGHSSPYSNIHSLHDPLHMWQGINRPHNNQHLNQTTGARFENWWSQPLRDTIQHWFR